MSVFFKAAEGAQECLMQPMYRALQIVTDFKIVVCVFIGSSVLCSSKESKAKQNKQANTKSLPGYSS
jgi:hypothetical protein